MKSSIRLATLDDVRIITRFNALIARETEGLELDLPRLQKGVEAILIDASKGSYYIAEIDDKIVGQLMITFEWSDWRNGNFWWIQSVYVDMAYRQQGVFTALYRYIETLARSRKDVCGLRLYVEENNKRAQQTYKNLGFQKSKYEMMEIDFVLK